VPFLLKLGKGGMQQKYGEIMNNPKKSKAPPFRGEALNLTWR